MTTIAPNQQIPDGLACRLALHFAQTANDPLAQFYWTGTVLPGIARHVEGGDTLIDSRGRRDSHAAAAEKRALISYFQAHADQGRVKGWLERRNAQWLEDYHELVVPWSWGQTAARARAKA